MSNIEQMPHFTSDNVSEDIFSIGTTRRRKVVLKTSLNKYKCVSGL